MTTSAGPTRQQRSLDHAESLTPGTGGTRHLRPRCTAATLQHRGMFERYLTPADRCQIERALLTGMSALASPPS